MNNLKIYSTGNGFTVIRNRQATNFTPSVKKTNTVGIGSGFQVNGTLLKGKSLKKSVLYSILTQLK